MNIHTKHLLTITITIFVFVLCTKAVPHTIPASRSLSPSISISRIYHISNCLSSAYWIGSMLEYLLNISDKQTHTRTQDTGPGMGAHIETFSFSFVDIHLFRTCFDCVSWIINYHPTNMSVSHRVKWKRKKKELEKDIELDEAKRHSQKDNQINRTK